MLLVHATFTKTQEALLN